MTDLDRIMSSLLKHVQDATTETRQRILEGGVENWADYKALVGYMMGAEQVAQFLIEKAKEIEDAEEAD